MLLPASSLWLFVFGVGLLFVRRSSFAPRAHRKGESAYHLHLLATSADTLSPTLYTPKKKHPSRRGPNIYETTKNKIDSCVVIIVVRVVFIALYWALSSAELAMELAATAGGGVGCFTEHQAQHQ